MPAPPSGTFEAAAIPDDVTLAPIREAGRDLLGYVARRQGAGGQTRSATRQIHTLAVDRFRAAAPPNALLFLPVEPAQLLDDELFASAGLAAVADRVVLQVRVRPHADAAELTVRVRRLRSLGYRFALRDLTEAPTSLALVNDLAPDFVKLDASGFEVSEPKRIFVRNLVALCHRLGATPIAHGVLSLAERAALAFVGCPLVEMPA